jgi:plasmid stabilization system protein ParE
MIYEIKFTPEAEETYDIIRNQLLENWGNRVVIQLEKKILKSLSIIAQSPLIYPVIDEPTDVRKCVIHKNCSILYRVFDHTVIVICFWDNRQEPIF